MATDEGISDLSGVYGAYYDKVFLSRLEDELIWVNEEAEWVTWLRGYAAEQFKQQLLETK